MNAEPMLPCPFCGSAPFPLEYPEGGETGEVRCLKLDCPIDDVFIPIEQWNRPRVKDPVISEPVAVFEIDKSGYRARVVLDPEKPFPSSGTKLYAEQAIPQFDMQMVMMCLGGVRGAPALTSNQCHALAQMLNACSAEVARLNGVKP